MKLFKIIYKNFKVLLRSKSSAFVVLLGPLLIIALISLALSNAQGYSLTVGLIAPDQEGLTKQFIDQLQETDYKLIYYNNVEECVQQIKLQVTNICIKFPANFVVSNENPKEMEFYADQSRLNLVESIVSSVSSTISLESEEISLGLTKVLLSTIDLTSQEIKTQKTSLAELKSEQEAAAKSIGQVQAEGQMLSSDLEKVGAKAAIITSANTVLKNDTQVLLQDLKKLIDQCEDLQNPPSSLEKVKDEYDKLSKSLPLETANITSSLSAIEDVVDEVIANIGSEEDDSGLIATAKKVKTNLEEIKQKTEEIEASIQTAEDKINKIQITSASSIINPFKVSVKPILSISDRSILMFPYFIVLVILFVGIMLSSTLVIMEKKSQAFFRNFTTPTSELYHILAGYLTNLAVLLLQLGVVFVGAFYYLKIPLLNNYGVSLLILFLTISFFIFLGAAIGYMFNSQEGTTIASISLGSLFIFLSNIILPVESFPEILRKILMFNPFMLCAEMFKKSMLFGAPLGAMKFQVYVLVAYVAIMAALAVLFQKMSFNRMFSGLMYWKVLRRQHITPENYFRMLDGALLKSKADLVAALRGMSDDEFKLYVNKRNNEIALWINMAFKEKRLARTIEKMKNREGIINAILQNQIPEPKEPEVRIEEHHQHHEKPVEELVSELRPEPKKKSWFGRKIKLRFVK